MTIVMHYRCNKNLHAMRKAINSSSGTIVRNNRHSQAVRRLLDSSRKIVAKSRDVAIEKSLFVSSSKNKVLTKEAGIAYLYKTGERG